MKYIKYLLLSFLYLMNFIQAEIGYRVIDLHPEGAVVSVATGINDSGQVVGFYQKEWNGTPIAFLWDKETGFKEIGEGLSRPKINKLGHVISTKNNPTYWNLFPRMIDDVVKIDEPYLWTPEEGIQILKRPPGLGWHENIYTASINDHDQIVMVSKRFSSFNKTWIWEKGKYKQIKHSIFPSHISNQQIISGYSKGVPMLLDLITDGLTTYPLNDDRGTMIMSNAEGDAIGTMSNGEDFRSFFLSQTSGLKILPDNFEAAWMNDNGLILGKMKTGYGLKEVFIYDGTNLINVSKPAGIGTDKTSFIGIDKLNEMNNHGQIVGSGRLASQGVYKKIHAILIEPFEVDLPAQ